MSTQCSICNHARRTEIDAALVAKTSLRDIAGRLGVSFQAVGRHARNGHVEPEGGPTSTAAPGPEASAYDQMKANVEAMRAVDTSKMSAASASTHRVNLGRMLRDLERVEPKQSVEESKLEAEVADLKEWMVLTGLVIELFPKAMETVRTAHALVKNGVDPRAAAKRGFAVAYGLAVGDEPEGHRPTSERRKAEAVEAATQEVQA